MHLVLLKLELVLRLDLQVSLELLQHYERQVVSELVVSVLAPLVQLALQVLAVLAPLEQPALQLARLVLLQQEQLVRQPVQLAQEFPA
jgi:hypothetical protein